jgi:hypothetical protein
LAKRVNLGGVANGKPGDHPVTDIVVWNLEPYSPEINALIREIHAYDVPGAFDPLTSLLFAAESDSTREPKLRGDLLALRDRLRDG